MTASDTPRSLLIASEPLTRRHLDLARGAGVLDDHGGAHAGRARLRDARPRCLTRGARPVASFLATRAAARGHPARRSWRSSPRVLRRRDAARRARSSGARATRPEAMLLVVDGRVSVSLRLPGDRTVEVASVRPGEVLGELPLLDGGRHSATARVAEPATVLALSRARLRRARLAAAIRPRSRSSGASPASACARLRQQLDALAASLGGDAADAPAAAARLPSSSSAGRRTARTCAAWRRSARSTRSRSGAS